MKEMECPICNEIVYSNIGKGCKMCGMPIEEEFCCEGCEDKYIMINE